jgi:hypothetical protein
VRLIARSIRLSTLLALTVGLFVLLPAVAQAGSYTVYSCQQDPSGGTGGWSATSADTEVVGASNGGCQAGDAGLDVFTEDTFGEQENVGINNFWQFQAPAGTSIGDVSLWMQGDAAQGWFLPITDSATGGSSATAVSATWGNTVQDGTTPSCEDDAGASGQNYPGCNSGGSNQTSPTGTPAFDNINLAGSTVVDIGVECAQANTGDTGPFQDCTPTTGNASQSATNGGAWQYLYGSKIQILDNQAPDITSVTIPSQPWVSGQQTVSDTDLYTADPVGISSETLTLKAASGAEYTVGWSNPACSDDNAETLVVSNVTYYVPCSDPGAESFSVNTANLPNGCYQTSVSITDPAGNTSTTGSGQMCVSNTAPGAIQNVSTSGSAWTDTTTGSIGWSSPTNDPAPVSGVLYTVNGGKVTSAPAGTSLSVSSLPEGSDTVCIWLEDAAGNSNQSNQTCETFKIDYEAPSFGALSYAARSGKIAIAASAISGLNPNSLSFSASDTAGTAAAVNGYLQGGTIYAQFPLVDSNRETWTLKVNIATNAGTAVTKSFVFYPTNVYSGPDPLTVSHYTRSVKVGQHRSVTTYLEFTPRKAAGSDSALEVSVGGTLVRKVGAGKSAVIAARPGTYTVTVELSYKGGEIIESSAKFTGSRASVFRWKIT